MYAKSGFVGVLLLFSLMLVIPTVFAGTSVQDIIVFDNKEGTVTFSHTKHYDAYYNEYPELYGSSCGECHHDKDNNNLENLKIGDDVQKCVECHKKSGYIKGKGARGSGYGTQCSRDTWHM